MCKMCGGRRWTGGGGEVFSLKPVLISQSESIQMSESWEMCDVQNMLGNVWRVKCVEGGDELGVE